MTAAEFPNRVRPTNESRGPDDGRIALPAAALVGGHDYMAAWQYVK